MAFLCPSRLGRNKQKRGFESLMERLAENGSIESITLEDLVKLSWKTPEARRIILQNFTSYAPQEITVKQGQKVNYIYRECDWAYVVTDDKKEGFVPFTFLAKIGLPSKPAPRPIDSGTYTKRVNDVNLRKISVESEGTDHSASDTADDSFASAGWSNDSMTECGSIDTVKERPSVNYLQTEPLNKVPMFYEVFLDERTNILHKNPLPAPDTFNERGNIHPVDDIGPPSPSLRFKVMYNFVGQDVYDVPVRAGEVVHLLDDSDPGWFWVCKENGSEGYVPSNYISELSEDSIDDTDIDSNENRTIKVKHQALVKADHKCNEQTFNKSNQNGLPIKWKVTNELKGKNPTSTVTDTTDPLSNNKKQRPKKPPRKKKLQQDGMSPRLDDSMGSLDTCITDSSIEYLDIENKSSCGDLSPRSNVFSESSILDSSYNEVYNHGQFGNIFFEELSPRSSNSLSIHINTDNTDMDETLESDFTHLANNNEKKQSDVINKVKCNKSSRYNIESGRDNTENTHRTEEERGSKETANVQQRVKHMSGSNRRRISDSFDNKSSHSQQYKRPLSMPAFKSYQEYKKDYFDEYFYEENDIKFASRSKNNVVNVSEILKLRKSNGQRKDSCGKQNCDANSEQYHDNHSEVRKILSINKHRNEPELHIRGHEKIKQSSHNQPKLKQFLFDLPSTKLEHNKTMNINHNFKTEKVEDQANESLQNHVHARKRFNSSTGVRRRGSTVSVEKDSKSKDACDVTIFQQVDSDVKITKTMVRQFNSSTDLRQTEVKKQKEKGQRNEIHKLSVDMSNKLSENKENLSKNRKTHLRPYNSSTDLREIRGKPDWSFGYPRKTRKSIGRTENQNQIDRKCNESKRSRSIDVKRNRKQEDEHKKETKGGPQKVNNFETEQNRGSFAKDYEQVYKTRKPYTANAHNKSYNNPETEVNMSFDDNVMMALLSQTDNLLLKTDRLLDDDKTQELGEVAGTEVQSEISTLSDERVNVQDNHDGKNLTKSHHIPNGETNASEKCNQFLKNNTIGIHGMTYFITRDSTANEEGITKEHTPKQNSQSPENSRSVKSRDTTEPKDIRKGKSNVMKDKSSKIVSDELKSLDLQDIRGITEFVCQRDYEPDTDNMLPIKHGEIVHIGLDGQDSGEWYWAFSPRLRKNGFVPKKFVQIPMVTII